MSESQQQFRIQLPSFGMQFVLVMVVDLSKPRSCTRSNATGLSRLDRLQDIFKRDSLNGNYLLPCRRC